jgi:hypothetical protein
MGDFNCNTMPIIDGFYVAFGLKKACIGSVFLIVG